MRDYVLTHLSDDVLERDLIAHSAHEIDTTAVVLAHIAEVDARKRYVPAGYPSMHAYCVGKLRYSEDAAFKRIQVARAGRQFPAIFAAIADQRIHLTAARYLAPYLTAENADELLAAAEHQKTAQIEQLIARRFDRSWPADVAMGAAGRVTAILPPPESGQALLPTTNGAPATDQQVLRPVEAPAASAEPKPERFHLECSIDAATHDKLQYFQALLGHAVPSGDLAKVLDRALDAGIAKLEKQKFAATDRPRAPRDTSARRGTRGTRGTTTPTRYIPNYVKRGVWIRDGGQCTFTSADGYRCESRTRLEFDHVELFARGGEPTVEGLRLRCQPHNQFGAERVLGADFMNEKRAEARNVRGEASRAAIEARRNATLASDLRGDRHGNPDGELDSDLHDETRDVHDETRDVHDDTRAVYSGLRNLGCRAEEARRAAEHAATLGPLTIEERLRAAIQFLGKGRARVSPRAKGEQVLRPVEGPIEATVAAAPVAVAQMEAIPV